MFYSNLIKCSILTVSEDVLIYRGKKPIFVSLKEFDRLLHDGKIKPCQTALSAYWKLEKKWTLKNILKKLKVKN